MSAGNLADRFQISCLRKDGTDISHHRLDDECGNVVIFGEKLLKGFCIIVGNLPGCRRKLRRNAGRVRCSMRERSASGGNQN